MSLVLLGEAISSTSENLYIVDDYQDDLGIQMAEIEFYGNFKENNEKFSYLFIFEGGNITGFSLDLNGLEENVIEIQSFINFKRKGN